MTRLQLVVDYLGVFDDVGRALMFDEKSVRQVITNLDEVKGELPKIWKKCVDYFPGVNRKVSGYEGLIAAQQCLPSNEKRDAFAADFSVFAKVWEALSPDPCLNAYEDDYRWLAQVYESIKPPSGSGKLLWHALGAKTIELIHQNIHVEAVQDNLETLVMDEKLLKEIIESQDPTKIVEIEINVIARIRRHSKNPKFIALGQRLEDLKERHEKGLLTSLAFLKLLLELAKDVVAAEKEVVPAREPDRGRAALTELFKEAKNAKTPVLVERIVNDIDSIVRAVRFDGWQQTTGNEREIKKALRSTLLKYQLHREHGALRPGLRIHSAVLSWPIKTDHRGSVNEGCSSSQGTCRGREVWGQKWIGPEADVVGSDVFVLEALGVFCHPSRVGGFLTLRTRGGAARHPWLLEWPHSRMQA